MDDFEKMEDEVKKENIIRALKNMTVTDGKIDDEEVAFMIQVGLSMGMEEEALRELMQDTNQDLYIPANEMERMTILYYLIFLVRADHEIQEEEKRLLFHYGHKLGFREEMVQHMIAVLQEHQGKNIPDSELINKVKIYLN